MARRTTLYQRARSPLIQGFSKLEKPLWESVVLGLIVSLVPWLAWFYVRRADVASADVWIREGLTAGFLYLIAATAGSALGALLARMWGARAAWLPAAVVGSAFGIVALVFISQALGRGVL